MNNVIGINREKLKNSILKLYAYRDKVNSILNDAQLLIDDTKNYYISDDGDYLRENFNKFYSNKTVIIQNINSYCTDLQEVMNNFQENQTKTIDIFRK